MNAGEDSLVEVGKELPKVDEKQMGAVALKLLERQIVTEMGLPLNMNSFRRSFIDKSKSLGIDPNQALAIVLHFMKPRLTSLFTPISSAEINAKSESNNQPKKSSQIPGKAFGPFSGKKS